MASATIPVCAICQCRHMSKPAIEWCLNCQEALCSDCSEHHKVSNASRDHTTSSISEYQMLPTFITSITYFCSEHNERFQQYCTQHASPICYKCIKTHNKCSGVLPLDEVIENAKTSDLLKKISERLTEIAGNFKKARDVKHHNISQIKEQQKRALDEIHNIRCKINQHLDQLELKLVTELNKIEIKCSEKNNKIISELDEKEKKLKQIQFQVQTIAKYASDFQIFLGVKQLEVKATDSESSLQAIMDSKKLDGFSIVFKIDQSLANILNSVETFGTAQLLTQPCGFRIFKKKERQAQIPLYNVPEVHIRPINDIQVTLVRKFNAIADKATGCCITGTGDLLFTDYLVGKLVAFSQNGSLKYSSSTEQGYAFDVSCLDKTTIAISTGDSSSFALNIIDVSTTKNKKCIKLPRYTYGVACNDASILCCVKEHNIHVISRANFSISTIPNTKLPDYTYVATFKEYIYYTNHWENAVYCCRLDGTQLWVFKDKSVLPCPTGITTDKHGNVLVGDERSQSIVLISSDGKQHRQVLGSSDGIGSPTGVFFDKTKNMLFVVSSNKSGYLYNVT